MDNNTQNSNNLNQPFANTTPFNANPIQDFGGLGNVPNHTHNGIDSQPIDPKDLLPFPVWSTVPTFNAPNGTIVLYSSGGTYKIYARLANGWRSGTLT